MIFIKDNITPSTLDILNLYELSTLSRVLLLFILYTPQNEVRITIEDFISYFHTSPNTVRKSLKELISLNLLIEDELNYRSNIKLYHLDLSNIESFY